MKCSAAWAIPENSRKLGVSPIASIQAQGDLDRFLSDGEILWRFWFSPMHGIIVRLRCYEVSQMF
jgi:hypothetical protein